MSEPMKEQTDALGIFIMAIMGLSLVLAAGQAASDFREIRHFKIKCP